MLNIHKYMSHNGTSRVVRSEIFKTNKKVFHMFTVQISLKYCLLRFLNVLNLENVNKLSLPTFH